MNKTEGLHLTVTPAQATTLIPMLEQEIAQIGARQTEAKGELNKIEKQYQKLKATSDELTELLKQKKNMLESILKHVGTDKSIQRLMRATSHTNQKPGQGGGIRWGHEFVNILKREQRFMTFDELKVAYKQKANIDFENEIIRRKLYQTLNNFKVGDRNLRQRIKEGKPIFKHAIPMIMYGKTFGLLEWFDQYKDGTMQPKANFMKQFVYQKAS